MSPHPPIVAPDARGHAAGCPDYARRLDAFRALGEWLSDVSIPAVPLTAAASAQLASADRYTLSVSFTATDTSASTDDTGSEAAAASPAAAIPALTGTGSVTFRAAGHAYINDTTGFDITPSAGGTAMAPIKCYNAIPSLSDWNITVTAPGVPLYQCVDSISAQPSWLWSLPMKITASGPGAVGGTERVTMTSGDTNFGPPPPTPAVTGTLFVVADGADVGDTLSVTLDGDWGREASDG